MAASGRQSKWPQVAAFAKIKFVPFCTLSETLIIIMDQLYDRLNLEYYYEHHEKSPRASLYTEFTLYIMIYICMYVYRMYILYIYIYT